MAKGVEELLIEVAPITQVFLALGGGLGLVAGTLPQLEFESALGVAPQLPPIELGISYSAYGGFARFSPTLFTALFDSPSKVFVTFTLSLLAGLAFLVAREAARNTASATRKDPWDARGAATPRSAGRLLSTAATWILIGAFAVVAVTQAVSYPFFTAPRRLSNLAVQFEKPTNSRWGFLNGDSQYEQLYGSFFGLPMDALEPDFPVGSEVKADGSDRRIRHLPTGADFRRLFAYYDLLAVWTVWTLLVVIALTLFASATILRSRRNWYRWAVASMIVGVTFVHLLQWTGLVYAYGRLYIPTIVMQQAATAIARAETASMNRQERHHPDKWPFDRLALVDTETKQKLQIEPDSLALRNYWPLRPQGSRAIAASCRRPNEPFYKLPDDGLIPIDPQRRALYRDDGLAVFDWISVGALARICGAKGGNIALYDGYTWVGLFPVEELLK